MKKDPAKPKKNSKKAADDDEELEKAFQASTPKDRCFAPQSKLREPLEKK
ncbi:MAG: hypothetical protein RBG13Loki_2183 [Promethearchaeota archaeon CR_4]|nr:MAG: hypothetical protein RBG13Loki_2183 [Candidatus Lokiarchaeota archaeon CR_4]